jgi:hypothetical protein
VRDTCGGPAEAAFSRAAIAGRLKPTACARCRDYESGNCSVSPKGSRNPLRPGYAIDRACPQRPASRSASVHFLPWILGRRPGSGRW